MDFIDVLQRIISLLDGQFVFNKIPRNGIDAGHPIQIRRALRNPLDDRDRVHIRIVERGHKSSRQSQGIRHLQSGLVQDACHCFLNTVSFRIAFQHDFPGQYSRVHV
ncbi:hypothetical protein SDC9_146401 [bioreactor metagenome]|uniref:Uncharacterized protein n=1 Tax=bioreactor metagenome TaxID=1076179 RepID=A0A645EBJ6_9ZZZZ